MEQNQQTNNGDQNSGGQGGGNAPAFTMDSAFDVNLVDEPLRPQFVDRKIGKVGDVVKWALDAEARAGKAATIGADTKLDLTKYPPDYQNIFTAKKIETVQGLADLAVNAEKKIGTMSNNVLPKPEAGKMVDFFKTNAEIFNVPKAATEYQWKAPNMPEGMEFDTKIEQSFKEYAHKRSIPQEMFQDLADFGAQMRIDIFNDMKAHAIKETADLQVALKKEWGQDEAKNTEIAKFAARQLGLEGSVVDKVSGVMGAPALIKMLHTIGSKMQGSELITGDGKTDIGAKDHARSELARRQSDKGLEEAFTDRNHQAHKSELAERERLNRIIHE